MLQTLFNLTELPKMLDATDALAVALCHHFHDGRIQTRGRNAGWKSFIQDNPDRLKNKNLIIDQVLVSCELELNIYSN